jgi:hypothetical protein
LLSFFAVPEKAPAADENHQCQGDSYGGDSGAALRDLGLLRRGNPRRRGWFRKIRIRTLFDDFFDVFGAFRDVFGAFYGGFCNVFLGCRSSMQPIHDLLNGWPLEWVAAQTLLRDSHEPLWQRLRQGHLLPSFI